MSAGDYVGSAVFVVNINGMELGFSKISGLTSGVEYDTYVEGGGQMHLFYKPSSTAGTLTMEKGISMVDQDAVNQLAPGVSIKGLSITLQKNGENVENYYIESGMVVSWQLGPLDALSSAVAVKTFTIAHTGITVSKG